MVINKNTGIYRWKRGVCGERQLEVNSFFEKESVNRTYPQKWHEYNLSQTSEKLMFLDLLQELANYIEIEQKKRRGRPRANLQEMLYCMTLLVYCGKSSRRTISELHLAKDRKHIMHVPHFNTILGYFNNQELRQHLQYLITLSSMPLKVIENDFTIDATGFTTRVFGRWFDYRLKERKDHRLWRKAHVMSGVKTNIITSIEISKGASSDTIIFPELLERTSKNFKLREVSGDGAYLSRNNLELISQKGAIPYIPFRKNSNQKSRGCLIWHRMFIYFQQHHEKFLEHYHKRSNAETVFSMIKRKFGNNLKMRNETAQDNEILCKALCHNIVVLIHELFELGINLNFEPLIKQCNFWANSQTAQKITLSD